MEGTPDLQEQAVGWEEKAVLVEDLGTSYGTISPGESVCGLDAEQGLSLARRKRRIRVRGWRVTLALSILVLVTLVLLASLVGLDSVCGWTGLCSGTFDDWSAAQDAPPDSQSPPEHLLTPPSIPQYVIDHAPFVYLDQDETYWPGDMGEHLPHTIPELDYVPIQEMLQTTLNLTNLDQLNQFNKGRHVFLTSKDDVQEHPDWLLGEKNIPEEMIKGAGKVQVSTIPKGGKSSAPVVLITAAKENGILDAFWFFFYSFNRGNSVFNIRWGNHVGDWEHTLIRFQYGKPELAYLSEHDFGAAYSFSALEKIGQRPVVYSAIGTHAMYATSGSHPYALPLGLLRDHTSRGPLWDPSLNFHSYTYHAPTDTLLASALTPASPVPWFYFNGHWGDKFYPMSDPRQYGFIGEYHYVNGPLGPRFKNLGRRKVCQGAFKDPCRVRTVRALEAMEVRIGGKVGEGEKWSLEGELRPPGLEMPNGVERGGTREGSNGTGDDVMINGTMTRDY